MSSYGSPATLGGENKGGYGFKYTVMRSSVIFEGCLKALGSSFVALCLLGTGREGLHSGRAIPAGVLFANVWDATRGAQSHVIEEEGADGEAGGEIFFELGLS